MHDQMIARSEVAQRILPNGIMHELGIIRYHITRA